MLRFAPALAALVVALSASAALAQTMEATPIPAPPKPDFSTMKYFLGSWSCSSKSARRPTPQLSTTVNTMDASGRWIVEKSVNQATSWFPYTSNEVDMITYDPYGKRWVDVETDTLGGYDLSASPGWKGNVMVWTDLSFEPNHDVTATTATRLTKVSATKMTFANTFTTKAGKTVGVSGSCVKT